MTCIKNEFIDALYQIADNWTEILGIVRSFYVPLVTLERGQVGEINYINDKWEINSGYEISGVDIWKRIKNDAEVNSLKFLTTYLYLKKIIKIDEESSRGINKDNFFNIQKAIDGQYRISFMYKKQKRIFLKM